MFLAFSEAMRGRGRRRAGGRRRALLLAPLLRENIFHNILELHHLLLLHPLLFLRNLNIVLELLHLHHTPQHNLLRIRTRFRRSAPLTRARTPHRRLLCEACARRRRRERRHWSRRRGQRRQPGFRYLP
jgi:hypothetical protein